MGVLVAAAGRRCSLAVSLMAVVALTACAYFPVTTTKGQSKPVTASTKVAPGRGAVVFSDDFQDPHSGWTTKKLPSGTSFAYDNGSYVSVAVGDLHHYAFSPYTAPVQQLSATATATLSTTSQPGGFGLGCGRGQGASEIDYEFLVTTDATWYVERAEGAISTSRSPNILKTGTAPASGGASPLTLEGLCATFAGTATTRLVLFIGGQQVADLTDTPSSLPNSGWTAELIIVSTGSAPTTVRVTSFVERNAAG